MVGKILSPDVSLEGGGGVIVVEGKEVREGMNRGRNRKTDKGRKGGRKEDQEGERRMKTIARL